MPYKGGLFDLNSYTTYCSFEGGRNEAGGKFRRKLGVATRAITGGGEGLLEGIHRKEYTGSNRLVLTLHFTYRSTRK